MVQYSFGIDSTSIGFPLSIDDTIVCDDILYIEANTSPSQTIISVTQG